jgi:arsenate reductase
VPTSAGASDPSVGRTNTRRAESPLTEPAKSIPPGLATTRMAARPSIFLQRRPLHPWRSGFQYKRSGRPGRLRRKAHVLQIAAARREPTDVRSATRALTLHFYHCSHIVMKKRVLILCTGNSARSQMAEGLLRAFTGKSVEVFSAGTKPSAVRAEAITVMSEIGIDLASHRSKHVREFDGQHFDCVITVCDNANEACPIFPGNTERIHWSFPDPAAIEGTESERLLAFRRVRDTLAERFRDLASRLDSTTPRS